MVQKEKTYNQELQELKKFLSTRRKLTELAKRSGATIRTVQYAFDAKKPEDLKGKRINVIKEAQVLKAEIEDTTTIK